MVMDVIDRYPCHLKIVNKRSTKHGDFKRYVDGKVQITINNDLNPYRFLLTLMHEFAHLVTFEEYKRVKPHGLEWKNNFKLLMLPFLKPKIFPDELLSELASYLMNPKASSDGSVNLSLAFRKFDVQNDPDKVISAIRVFRRIYRINTERFIHGICLKAIGKTLFTGDDNRVFG